MSRLLSIKTKPFEFKRLKISSAEKRNQSIRTEKKTVCFVEQNLSVRRSNPVLSFREFVDTERIVRVLSWRRRSFLKSESSSEEEKFETNQPNGKLKSRTTGSVRSSKSFRILEEKKGRRKTFVEQFQQKEEPTFPELEENLRVEKDRSVSRNRLNNFLCWRKLTNTDRWTKQRNRTKVSTRWDNFYAEKALTRSGNIVSFRYFM